MQTTSIRLLERLASSGENDDWQNLLLIYGQPLRIVVCGSAVYSRCFRPDKPDGEPCFALRACSRQSALHRHGVGGGFTLRERIGSCQSALHRHKVGRGVALLDVCEALPCLPSEPASVEAAIGSYHPQRFCPYEKLSVRLVRAEAAFQSI
jgi:hypothetical protein